MLTKKDLQTQYGDDIMFIFKGCEPFTEMNNAPAGVLIERSGKVICYECGELVNSIGTHCHKHKMTAREYKIKYGFNLTAGLCSKQTSHNLSSRPNIARDNKDHYKNTLVKYRENGGKQYIKTGTKSTVQRQNGFGKKGGVCMEQMKQRLELVIARFGEGFSETDARQVDWYLVEWSQRNFGSFNNMKKKFGLKINLAPLERKKKTADLIFDLRSYLEDNGSLPFKVINRALKAIDNFPHSHTTYKDHFGSFAKALAICGIERRKKEKGCGYGYNYKLIY